MWVGSSVRPFNCLHMAFSFQLTRSCFLSGGPVTESAILIPLIVVFVLLFCFCCCCCFCLAFLIRRRRRRDRKTTSSASSSTSASTSASTKFTTNSSFPSHPRIVGASPMRHQNNPSNHSNIHSNMYSHFDPRYNDSSEV